MEYANYEHLMRCWKDLDGPDALFDINYETLVGESKTEVIDQLWKHCGLIGNYDEKKRREHFGYTASFQQVTKEIYDTSVMKSDFVDFRDDFYKDLENQRNYWINQ